MPSSKCSFLSAIRSFLTALINSTTFSRIMVMRSGLFAYTDELCVSPMNSIKSLNLRTIL